MTDIPPLDAFHAHEVLHTASIIADLFEERIEEHPYTQAHPEILDAAKLLSTQLQDFYQLVGRHTVP
jgi:hypothetical protein